VRPMPSPVTPIGHRFNVALAHRGMSIQKAIDVERVPTCVSNVSHDKRRGDPSLATLTRLALLGQCSIGFLLGETEDRTPRERIGSVAENFDATLAARNVALSTAIEESGLTVSEYHVKRYRDRDNPRLSTLRLLAHVANTDVSTLLGERKNGAA